MLSMLEWLCHKLMEVEVDTKVGAVKGEHSKDRFGYRSGTRADVLIPAWEQCTCWCQKSAKEAIYLSL
jgi:hypothetical protein